MVPESDPAEVEQSITEDWTKDSGGTGQLGFEEFSESMLELADLWCKSEPLLLAQVGVCRVPEISLGAMQQFLTDLMTASCAGAAASIKLPKQRTKKASSKVGEAKQRNEVGLGQPDSSGALIYGAVSTPLACYVVTLCAE